MLRLPESWTRLRHARQAAAVVRLSRRFVDEVIGRYRHRVGAWRGVLVHLLLGSASRAAEAPWVGWRIAPAVGAAARTVPPALRSWIPAVLAVGSANVARPGRRDAEVVRTVGCEHREGASAHVSPTIARPVAPDHGAAPRAPAPWTSPLVPLRMSAPTTTSGAGAATRHPIDVVRSRAGSRLSQPVGAPAGPEPSEAPELAPITDRVAARPGLTTILTPFPSRDEPPAATGTVPPARLPALARAGMARIRARTGDRWHCDTGNAVVAGSSDGSPEQPRPALARPEVPPAGSRLAPGHEHTTRVKVAPHQADDRPTVHGRREPAPTTAPRLVPFVASTLAHGAHDAAGLVARAAEPPYATRSSGTEPMRGAAAGTPNPHVPLRSIPLRFVTMSRLETDRSWRAPGAMLPLHHPQPAAPRAQPSSSSARVRFAELTVPMDVTVRDAARLRAWKPAAKWHAAAVAAAPPPPRAAATSVRTVGELSSEPFGTLRPANATPAFGAASLAPSDVSPASPLAFARVATHDALSSISGGSAVSSSRVPLGAPTLAFAPSPANSHPDAGSKDKRSTLAGDPTGAPDAAIEPSRIAGPGPGDVRRIADAVYGMILDRVRRERISRGW